MENFNALLTLSELKTLYSKKPVGICPLYKGVLNVSKTFEATGNPVIVPEYVGLEKLKIEFLPKQAGTGDPSPENVRPISGWDSVKVTVSNGGESHDYNVTLPETIYGGTVDAVTGEGEKKANVVVVDGETIKFNKSNEYWNLPRRSAPGVANRRAVIKTSAFPNSLFSANEQYSFIFTMANDMAPYFSTAEELNAFCATQYAAGTPLTIVYLLAAPEPFKVSQISIPSLGSENNFFTNGENLDIIYKVSSFWG